MLLVVFAFVCVLLSQLQQFECLSVVGVRVVASDRRRRQQQQKKSSLQRSSLNGHDSDNNQQPRNVFLQNVLSLSSATAVVFGIAVNVIPVAAVCNAVETVGKDPNCNDASCLGVWDGLLADCIQQSATTSNRWSAGCVSSQDDTPGLFSEPWDYSDDLTLLKDDDDDNNNYKIQPIMEGIINAIQVISDRRGDRVDIVLQQQRYLHVLFTDRQTGEISDGEFYITPNDTTIQFRIAPSNGATITTTSNNNNNNRRGLLLSSLRPSFRNIDRAEMIRVELRWLKLPILRNRQRALFFVESDLDTFGPRSAAIGPPEAMRLDDINNGN